MSEKQKVRIMEICSVDATRKDGKIHVEANGLVNSGGWSNGELALLMDTPNDGILDFMFVAEPPNDYVTQGVSSIHAETIIDDEQATSCVIVHAMKNSELDCL